MAASHQVGVFTYRENQVYELRKIFGLENEVELNKSLDTIEEWVRKQNHFLEKNIDRRYIEFMLIQCKGSIEKTKKRLDKYYTFRSMVPELLKNFDIKNEFKNLPEYVYHCLLPKSTDDYYTLTLGKVYNDEKFDLLQYIRYMVVGLEYCLHNGYNQGYIGIIDLQNIGFGMLSKINPILLQKFLAVLKDCYAGRVKAIHLINASKFIDTIVSLLKQAMTAKMASRLQVHNNWESLHKYIPKELLPSDYGGDLKSIKELQEDTFKAFTSDELAEVIKRNEKYKTDESLRLSSKFNEEYMGTPGSFRMLSVD